MSMSPAYHLLSKAMQGEALNENQVKTIVGVTRKDGRLKERERIIRLLLDYGTTIDTRTAEEMIRGN